MAALSRRLWPLRLVLAAALSLFGLNAAWSGTARRRVISVGRRAADSIASCGLMLPIGPLCPFRSEFWSSEAFSKVAEMDARRPRAMELMTKMQRGMISPEEQLELSKAMCESNDFWLANQLRLRYAEDFQGIEAFKITEERITARGVTIDMMEALVRWNSEWMSAMAEKRPPPPPPPGMDITKMQQIGNVDTELPMAEMAIPFPFLDGSKALKSDLVQEELSALTRDHENLIRFGNKYGSFDPLGKEAFLDQVALIQERWQVFMTRFELMGELNPEFVAASNRYFMRGKMSAQEFNSLVHSAQERMRADAQAERMS